MVTGQECSMGIGGCNRLCPAATGHSLVALFSLSVSIMDPGQVTDLLSRAYTCLWERKDLFLSCHGFRLFSDRLIGGGNRWRCKHCIEAEPQVWGLESKFGRGLKIRDRSGTGWSRLCLGCKRGMCFSGYPAGHIDSRITVST
jgi:hypothetical protein